MDKHLDSLVARREKAKAIISGHHASERNRTNKLS